MSLAAEHGLAPAECLRGSGIALSSLEDPVCEIEAPQELAVVRNLVPLLGHALGIALDVGRRYRLTRYGILGYSEVSSFVHAFKRWKGISPRAYRRRITDESPRN